jgi:ABC-2 type transport system permease protein
MRVRLADVPLADWRRAAARRLEALRSLPPLERVLGRERGRVTPGWQVVAGKELADNLHSVRFYILIALITFAGVVAVITATGNLRDAADEASQVASPFLLLFTISPEQIPSFTALIGFLGPLLGIAFGFDALNNERAQRTLPRRVAQPLHRDDIINGKFVAALGVIALTFATLVAVMASIGILRLGAIPSGEDVGRLVVYVLMATAYVGVWLGFALLCSVTLARAATSALVALAIWIVLTVFGTLLIGLLAGLFTGDATNLQEAVSEYELTRALSWISPQSVYAEATSVLLNPEARAAGLVLPQQVDRAIPGSELPLTQSILVVWPQLVTLIAACVVIFAVAYVLFLRQEVRA